jgi:hypothetical protein
LKSYELGPSVRPVFIAAVQRAPLGQLPAYFRFKRRTARHESGTGQSHKRQEEKADQFNPLRFISYGSQRRGTTIDF